jgi:tetratricopeptide (TPR) repeat protein
MDLHGTKIYFILLDRLGAIDMMVEELDGAIGYYKDKLVNIIDEISKINDDELMVKAAVKKQNIVTALLHYALKRRTQTHVFLGEFDSAVKLYEESKTFAIADEDDKFFDLLFNQKVVNFENIPKSTQIVTNMARTSMLLSSERKKFIQKVDAKVDTMDEISFFTICLAKKTTVINLFQLEFNNLTQNDENNLKAYWTKVESYHKSGIGLKLVAIDRMGWEHVM